jgi:hypothetical protein
MKTKEDYSKVFGISFAVAFIIFLVILVLWKPLIQPALIGPVGSEGSPGKDGQTGATGPQGLKGQDGKNGDPTVLLSDPDFLVQLNKKLSEPIVDNPFMVAYQQLLEYTNPSEVQTGTLDGFTPVKSLVMNPDKLVFPIIPQDLNPYIGFVDVAGVWGSPVAGYNDGENWSCDSPNGWCADDIQALNWRVVIGYEVCHPAVGCLKDPDGGAVMILFINFHDSDEVWGPRNNSAIYVDNGFVGYGPMWDLDGTTHKVEDGVAAIRNHYLFQLGYPHPDNHLEGQCGSSGLCNTVTYVVVYRMPDRPDLGINFSHYQLVDFGQWSRP